jgi:CBS domain-containing protein
MKDDYLTVENINITLKDVMVSPVLAINVNETAKTAASIMGQKEIGCLIVMDDGQVVGIVTERDLINRIIIDNKDPEKTHVKEIMSKPPVIAKPELSLEDAVRIMFANKIKKLIIVEEKDEEKSLVGLVTLTDIARINPALIHLLKSLFEEESEVPPRRIEKTMNYYIV